MIPRKDLLKPLLRWNCDLIVLTHAEISVRGPGQLWRSGQGEICYQIHVNLEEYQAFVEWASKSFPVYSDNIPASLHFSFEANFLNGDILRSGCTLPLGTSKGAHGAVFRGKLAEAEYIDSMERQVVANVALVERLKSLSDDPARANDTVVLEAVFHGSLDFPFNAGTSISRSIDEQQIDMSGSLNALIVIHGEYRLTIYQDDGFTVVKVELPRRLLSEFTPNRVHESLQFTLGKRVSLVACEIASLAIPRIKLFPGGTVSSEEGRSPVFSHRDLGNPVVFGDLLGAYFSHVNKDQHSFWHPLSVCALSGIVAEGASLEVKLMSLSVGIEGAINTCNVPGTEVEADGALGFAVDNVLLCVKNTYPDLAIQSPISIKLNQLKKVVAVQRLRAFLEVNKLDADIAKVWVRVRGKYAHGGRIEPSKRSEAEAEFSTIRTLMHILVFSAVCYAGPYLDYSTGVRRVSTWPPKS